MRYLIIIFSLIIVVPVFGQRKKNDEPIVVAPTYEEGITYALPRTGLRVYVRAIKETFDPGPYAGYAVQLLGLQNVKTRPESKWSVTEVRFETFSEPDPEQVYKAMGDFASILSLTSDGCLSAINATNMNVQAVVLKTNKLLQVPDAIDDFSFDNFTDTPFYIPGDSTNSFQPIRVTTDQKAAEAAKRVLDARMNIYDIAAGMLDEFHPDGEAYKVSLEQLKEIEKNYLSLFVGRTTQKNDIFSFNFIPTKAEGKGEVIFRISDENGIVPPSDLSGKPVMVEFEVDDNLVEKYTELAESENPSAGENGIYYRMPGVANVKIVNELNTISSARITIAQFGTVAPLPEELLEKGYVVRFHPDTGAIKSISKR
jgi:hypothetical protein